MFDVLPRNFHNYYYTFTCRKELISTRTKANKKENKELGVGLCMEESLMYDEQIGQRRPTKALLKNS